MPEVARRDVREREQLHAGFAGDEGGLAGCRVPGLARPLALLGKEGRLVDQEVCTGRRVDDRTRRRRIAREDDLPSGAWLAENVFRRDHPSVRERHALAPLEEPALAPVRYPEAGCFVHVEPPRPLILDERIPDRGHAVIHLERLDRVTVPLEASIRVEHHGRDGVGQAPEDALERAEKLLQSRWPVDRQRNLPTAESERLEHSRETEVVVGVVVREEDLLELGEADVTAQELPLRPLRTVEEEPIAAAPHERRTGSALRRGHGARRPEKNDVQLHGDESKRALNDGLVATDTRDMRRMRAYRSSGLLRSLTLLRAFLIASAAILVVGAVALSSALSGDLRDAALKDNALDVSAYADAVVAPALVRGREVVIAEARTRRLGRTIRLPSEVRGLNVFTRDGRLAFSTTQPERIGRRRSSTAVREAIETGAPSAAIVDPMGASPSVVKVWAPLHSSRGTVAGAVEVSLDDSVVTEIIDDTRRTVWFAVGLVFGVLWLVLALLVRGASERLRAQNEDLAARSRDLAESSRELESTLLETVETLNAAVEARDPYTAGHAQRVRRISLAIGRELRLPARQLGALATAALFHDIGKIGMPDSILTKPERLDRAEAMIMREHVTRGAEIVSRISSLSECVPAIRHHHERWDGLGYPDRLCGTDVPVNAAIIAIADSWDAMTTDRPYAVALETSQAMLEIQAGRGKQFNPAVVDAFLSVARRRPAEIEPAATRSAVAAAGDAESRCNRGGERRLRVCAPGIRASADSELRQIGVHHLAFELPRLRIPGEEDRVAPLETLPCRLVLEPAGLMSGRHARLLAHALRADDDVLEIEVDVRKRREELGVEARCAFVTLPARAGSHDLVDAVLRQGRDEPRQVAVVLGDRVRLPELADLRVLVDVDLTAEKPEDSVGGHWRVSTTRARAAHDLRHEQALAGNDGCAAQSVRLLELPDAGARISAIPLGRDRPQRLTRMHSVHLRRRPRAGVAREHGPKDDGDEQDDDHATEHVFAL